MITRANAIINPTTGKIIVQIPMPPITCLALEGGGSRCAAYTGLYKVLRNCGLINEVVYVSGSSGGAMGALAIALGLESEEAEKIMISLKMETFLEGQEQLIPKSDSLWNIGKTIWSVWRNEKHSLASGNEIVKWIEPLIEKKLGTPQPTFRHLAERIEEDIKKYGKSDFKYLYITGTNLSLEMPECEIFSHETTPDMPIALAIRISTSIPFVFEPVRWNNHLYSDGGLMQNLPSNFDERRFIPKGYDFTDKGMNPAVLAIKVDSRNEINQVLWGIVKEVDLNTAGEVATAVYNALSQNTNIEEIREARMTLALSDNNIGALEFSVDEQGKLDLISCAESETQDFVENYYRAAYNVKTYDNKLAWLNALTLDELDQVIYAYQLLYNECCEREKKAEVVHQVGVAAVDPDVPTALHVKTYLKFLNQYFKYKRRLIRDPSVIFEGIVPPFHINLKPTVRDHGWSKHLEADMKKKLVYIQKQIIYSNKRVSMLLQELEGIPPVTKHTYLRDPEHFNDVQAITGFREYRKIIKQEQKEIKIKLGCYDEKSKHYSAEQSKKYAEFFNHLNPYIIRTNPPKFLKAVLSPQFPIVKFDSCGYFKKMVFMFDLLHEYDRKCFIIAACYFLKHFKSPDLAIFEQLYTSQVSTNIPLPTNIEMLGDVLELSDASLLVAAYRIEELIRYFEMICSPSRTPTLTLDAIYALPPIKPLQGKWPGREGVEMQHVITSCNIFSNHYEAAKEKGWSVTHHDSTAAPDIRKMLIENLKSENSKDEIWDDKKKPHYFFK